MKGEKMEETKNIEKEEKKKRKGNYQFSKKEVDEIIESTGKKLHEFIKAGKYKEILMMMANLGKYSLTNQIYILLQNPQATRVNTMRNWNYEGRSIVPGSKALRIMMPIKSYEYVDKLDENDNAIIDEKTGMPIQTKIETIKGYKAGYVFDISETKGKEFTVYKFDETKKVEDKKLILEGLNKVLSEIGYSPIEFVDGDKELGAHVYGQTDKRNKTVKLREGMSDLQTLSTAVHECGHALAHTDYRKDFEGLNEMEKREIKEVEAESIACVVCTHLGLDTTNFNFSYITGWSDGDISKFQKNLDVVSKHSLRLIKSIDEEFEKRKIKEAKEKKEEAKKEVPFVKAPVKSSQAVLG